MQITKTFPLFLLDILRPKNNNKIDCLAIIELQTKHKANNIKNDIGLVLLKTQTNIVHIVYTITNLRICGVN